MTKYLKIAPDPDAKPCRCGEGNPDCDHFEFCPECGEEYKAHEGHDCLDGFAVAQVGTAKELRDAAKELRDAMDACETERDRLRAQLAALQAEVSQLQSREKACATMDQAEKVALVRMGQEIAAILGANDPSPAEIVARVRALQAVPQGVEVPELVYSHEESSLVRAVGGNPEWDAAVFGAGYNLAKARARLVPTPPQPLQSVPQGVELTEDDVRRALMSNAIDVDVEGVTPRLNRIIVSRLVPTTIKPLQPEERRVVEMSKAAFDRAALKMMTAYKILRRESPKKPHADIGWMQDLLSVGLDALRTSAQDHNGEGAKYKGPSGTTDGGGCMADAFC